MIRRLLIVLVIGEVALCALLLGVYLERALN